MWKLHLPLHPSGAADLPIEGGIGGSLIGVQKQVADAKGEQAQNDPADEAQLQAEQPPAVAPHQLFGPLNGLAGRQVRVLGQDVARHGIAVRGHDTGDDEQQRPQEDEHPLEQIGDHGSLSPGEITEQAAAGTRVKVKFDLRSFQRRAAQQRSQQSGQHRHQPLAPQRLPGLSAKISRQFHDIPLFHFKFPRTKPGLLFSFYNSLTVL